ncbi:MAG: flavodoxin-dependent (E)-4-hydroxy-3-methylbut-2-enyl-diphosphate synthase [Planctomycetes bacterium]|nr:flavodoxin-dependent (E)-4-hydroxy-3-methylbut-2-enyl-diphosphate synthase [Planctomycetota bacterium]
MISQSDAISIKTCQTTWLCRSGAPGGRVMQRKQTRQLAVGGVCIGGDAPITVQTMTRAGLDDTTAVLEEIATAHRAGADVVRVAVPSADAAAAFGIVAARSPLPLVADTHFDWRATLAALANGAAKVRINPGNMNPDGLARVADEAGKRGVPIRVGVNSGSIGGGAHPGGTNNGAAVMVDKALAWADRLERLGFNDIVLSFKSHSAAETVEANRMAARLSRYPLHLGVTAAGPREDALLKSAAAIGSLLLDGIGDTIRFSFTGDMLGEIAAGRALLHSLGLTATSPVLIACPACGRCRVDLPALVEQVKTRLTTVRAPLRIAVMGCEVNGPGEARDADVGIASAGGTMHLFVKGEVKAKLPPDQAVDALIRAAEQMAQALENDRG